MSYKFFMLLIAATLWGIEGYAQLSNYQPLDPQALEINFEDEQGKKQTLEKFKGKVVLVNLWAPYCGPCVHELPSINRLREVFLPEELEIIPLCTSPLYKEQARSTFVIRDIDKLNLYFASNDQLIKSLNLRGIPVTLIIDKSGNLIGRLEGASEWDHHENIQLIDDIIKGKSEQPLNWYQRLLQLFKN